MQTRLLIVEDQTALAENLFEFLGETHYTLDFTADAELERQVPSSTC